MKAYDWPRIDIITIEGPDGTSFPPFVEYSMTPDEFIEMLIRMDTYVFITNRCCQECFYTPESLCPRDILTRYEQQEYVPYHRALDCIGSTVAHVKNQHLLFTRAGDPLRVYPTDFIVCYGFYYQHWHENKYLKAAREAERIFFVPVEMLPTFAGSGLMVPRRDAIWFTSGFD